MSKNEEMKLLEEHYKKDCEGMEIEFYNVLEQMVYNNLK